MGFREQLTQQTLTLDLITEHDRQLFINQTIQNSQLPRGGDWLWNQSRAKVLVDNFLDNYSVEFFKLNNRRTRTCTTTIPSYKIWIYLIGVTRQPQSFTFIWCEKGRKNELNTTSTRQLDSELLQELNFLRRFVSQETASEFGW